MNTLIVDITWWQATLLAIYVIYIIFRACHYFEDGIKKGLLGFFAKDVRLYHLIWAVVDIPAILLGRIYHVIKYIFSVKVFTFKDKENGK